VSSRGGPAWTGDPSWQPTAGGAAVLGRAPGRSGSADPQRAVADLGQGALGAPALGPVDEFDDLPALDLGDGVAPGHGVPDVALPARAGDEPDQGGRGRGAQIGRAHVWS